MLVLRLDFSQSREILTDRQADIIVAEKIMGWTLWNDDWYKRVDDVGWKFQQVKLWSPTGDGSASLIVWLRCLERARELHYELSMQLDDQGRVHINGDHPTLARLLVVDSAVNHAIVRFAFRLFGIERP